MAVRAQQHALARLRPCPLQGPRHAAMAQRKSLLRRVNVMEVKRGHTAVVSAQPARSTGLLDEDLLDPSTTARHGIRATLRASIAASAAPQESRPSVQRALERQLPLSIFRRLAPISPTRRQAVLAQPMTHGRLAAPELARDLSSGKPGPNQLLQLASRQRALGGMALAAVGLQAVFRRPVPHRRSCLPTRCRSPRATIPRRAFR